MAERRIRLLGDPVLWQKSEEVADPAGSSIRELAEDLRDTLARFRKEHGYGRGIAAPQIGVLKKVIAVNVPEAGFDAVLVNPRVIRESEERVTLWDDCFSFPGILVRVTRAAKITVGYQDPEGAERNTEAEGGLSELLQHEIDHLDGILALDRAVSPHSLCLREEWERRYGEV